MIYNDSEIMYKNCLALVKVYKQKIFEIFYCN